ncbi:hypothetical protein [Riemerella columbina]|uniref:hypothetical protein n=1 Tax=Riemerella columbina TaxID=103810 RepID=UPI00036EE31E|nr:hypothetical protein [Riemerella columbina]
MRIFLFIILLLGFQVKAQSTEIKNIIVKLDKADLEGKTEMVDAKIQQLLKDNKYNTKNLALIKAFQGRLATRKEDFENAQGLIDKAFVYAEKSKDSEALAYTNYVQSFYYRYLNINNLSLEYVNKALELLPKNTDYYLESRLFYNLYGLYSDWDNVEKSEEYINLCMQSARKAKDYDMIANAYSAKSTIMRFQYAQSQNPIYQDSVLYYLNQVEVLNTQQPNKISPRTYAISTINTANYYFERWMRRKNSTLRDGILLYLNKTHNALKTVYDKDEILANAMGIEASIAMDEKRWDRAEKLFQNAYTMLLNHKPPLYYTLTNISEGLTQLYTQQGNYQKALYYKEQQKTFQDSIYRKQQIENTYKTEALYKNKQIKRELEITQQTAEARQTRNYLLIAVVVLLSGSLFFLFRYSQQKMKFQRVKALRLQQEKAEAEMKIQLEKEEQKRLRAEQELLQLKNQRIEKENLAKSLQIQRKNELLSKIYAEEDLNLRKILRDEKRIDESLEASLNEFKSIQPQFFEQLNELSGGKLTPLDQRYCGYLYLNLSTKEIATLFSVEPKSVRMTKYRIKQKLNIGEQSLEDFLQSLKG